MVNKLQFGGWVGGFNQEFPWEQKSSTVDYDMLNTEAAIGVPQYIDVNGRFNAQGFNNYYQNQYTRPLQQVKYTDEERAFLNTGTNAPSGGWQDAVWDMEEEDMSYVNKMDRQGMSIKEQLESGTPTKKQERYNHRVIQRDKRLKTLLDKYNAKNGAVNSASTLFAVANLADQIGWTMQDRADATKIDQYINNIPGFGLVNSAFGKKTMDFSINEDVQSQIGGSYSGTSDLFNKASNNERVGLAGRISGAVRRLNKAKRKALQQQSTMEGIAKEAEEQQFAAQSDLNAQAYNTQTLGGFDPRYGTIRNAKGGKLENKIDFIKSKQLNTVVNISTKKIEEVEVDTWEPVITFKQGGAIEKEWQPTIVLHQDGGKSEWTFDSWFNSIPESNRNNSYDYKKAFETHSREQLEAYAKDPEKNHLYSVSNTADENGYYPFLKLGKIEDNPEIQGEFDWYNSEEGKEHKAKFDIKYINDRYYYVHKQELTFEEWLKTAPEKMRNKFLENFELRKIGDQERYVPKELKEGGKVEKETPELEETTQKNVIPEGALHKNKHHIEHTEGLTQKGIPVIDNEGNQQAEVEVNELILTLEVTKAIEELYEKYYNEDSKQLEKDQAATEAGKILVYQILHNTDDRTNLIDNIEV